MTSKEAVDLFKQYYWKVEDKEKALEILEELAERDTPKKPLMSTHGYTVCPNCFGNGIRNNGDNDFELDFCTICGQRLNWNDEDET